LGYDVHWKIMDARNVVPQHRERVYVVGFRDRVDFDFPDLPDLKPTMRQILDPEVDPKYRLTEHLWEYLQDYMAKHRAKGNGFGYGLVSLDGISRTLSARYYKDGAEILIPMPDGRPRRLTPRECARIMGFPDSFAIPVSDTQAYRQFGNSVVVPVVAAVAKSIASCLRSGPSESVYASRGRRYTLARNGSAVAREEAVVPEATSDMVRGKQARLPLAWIRRSLSYIDGRDDASPDTSEAGSAGLR